MAIPTTNIFLASIEKSGLLSAKRLAEALEVAESAGGAEADVKTIAIRLIEHKIITRWQAEQLLAGHTVLSLGKYKLLERIGKGGMGAVYKAEHTVMGRIVALKVMASALLNDSNAVARFHREVQAAAALNHPNIVSAFDADCVGKTHFLVMEYARGHDLTHWLDGRGPLPIAWSCECMRQVAMGLQHAHEHGMVHRDIKPSNLLVTSESPDGPPIVKILDMGLARFVNASKDDGALTQSGQLMGTPDYISPEQAEDTRHADIRADIFSLGCTLYQLLTTHLPFPGENIMAKLMARLQTSPAPVTSLRSDIPPALEAVIAKMLATAPADRQQTPAEVAADLAPFASSGVSSTDETVSLSAQMLVPTVHSKDQKSDGNTGLNLFLDHMASESDVHPRLRHSTTRRRSVTSEEKPDETAGVEQTARSKVPRIVALIAVGAIVLGLVIAVPLVLRNQGQGPDLTSKAQVGPQVGADVAEEAPPEEPMVLPSFVPLTEQQSPEKTKKKIPPKTQPTEVAPPKKKDEPTEPKSEPEKAVEAATTKDTANNTGVVSPAPPRQPQTLVVGVEDNQLPDLKTAFEKSVPGDTILILHRGPLEFDPIDLTGKTPLSIVGGSDDDGTDFWPILRQATSKAKEEPVEIVAGLFHADQLNLKLQKVHLAAAGPRRANVGAVFAFNSGRIELDHCTVTVGITGLPGGELGNPLPLVRLAPPSALSAATGDVGDLSADPSTAATTQSTSGDRPVADVILNHTFLRGTRLQSCVDALTAEPLSITANETIWAGGPAPWVVVNDSRRELTLSLTNCTVYNASQLLQWSTYDEVTAAKSDVDIEAQKCLFVGPYANKEPFIAWNPSDPRADFTDAAAKGFVRWRGVQNIFHRYNGFYSEANRNVATLRKWRLLWKQSGPDMARESDPYFRVWPDRFELQETYARDLQPRFWRNQKRGQGVEETDIGADYATVPRALPDIIARESKPPKDDKAKELAGTSRGTPRVLAVNQSDGPYKTIEDAFADLEDGDIIEITDDGIYVPKRNFAANPGTAIFDLKDKNATIRAATAKRPVIVFDDRPQTALPTIPFVMFNVANASLQLEGLHFVYNVSTRQCRLIQHTVAGSLRVNYCSILDPHPNRVPPADYKYTSAILSIQDGRLWWENNVVMRRNVEFNTTQWGGNYTLARNCLVEGAFLDFPTRFLSTSPLRIVHCSVLGGTLLTNEGASKLVQAEVSDSLVMGEKVVLSADDRRFNNLLWKGTNNVLAAPTLLTIKGVGTLKTLSQWQKQWGREGSVGEVSQIPQFEGPNTAKDPYRRYRLKKGQPMARMASDGGPVGVRMEYLPDVPKIPSGVRTR